MASLFRFRKPVNENPLVQQPKKDVITTLPQQSKKDIVTTLPQYPSCPEKLMGHYDGWICCVPVFRALGNKSAQIYLRKRVQKVAAEKGWEEKFMTHEWNQKSQVWYPLPLPHTSDWAVPVTELGCFVTWALERSRKTREERLRLFALFDIQLNEKEIGEIKGPVENELLAVLSQCLPFKVEYQYRVDKYRLDAFIPRLRLAIQIDEHGHRGYNESDEKEYDEVIRDNNIVCLRFNPDQKYSVPPQYELVRQVWERTMSPDFGAFREKHKLC